MNKFILAAIAFTSMATPSVAQGVGSNVSANVSVGRTAIDPARLADLRCRLGFVNPRACSSQPQPTQRPTTAGNRSGTVSGARRP